MLVTYIVSLDKLLSLTEPQFLHLHNAEHLWSCFKLRRFMILWEGDMLSGTEKRGDVWPDPHTSAGNFEHIHGSLTKS